MLPTREQEVEEAIRACCAEASAIASMLAIESSALEYVAGFDAGLKEGVSGALAPLYAAMYEMKPREEEKLRGRLYAAVRGTVLAIRSYKVPAGQA